LWQLTQCRLELWVSVDYGSTFNKCIFPHKENLTGLALQELQA